MPVQLDLWSISPPVSSRPAVSTNDPDAFGCCSRYRSCSAAGKCLIPGLDYSAHCSYRKNLEAGRIFYGKNSCGFSADRYCSLCSAVGALPDGARLALDSLVVDFCEYRRGANFLVVRRDVADQLSGIALFDFRPLGSLFPKMCGFRCLSPLVSSHPVFGPQFQQAKKDGKGKSPGPNSEDFLEAWLNHDGVPLRDELSEPYRIASIRPGMNQYLEEFYLDTLSNVGYDSRIYPRSPLAEDGLLSTSDQEDEELHRIALSRGYSQEEKVRLEAPIRAAQAARAERARKRKEEREKKQKNQGGSL